jgi:hypothetical protein
MPLSLFRIRARARRWCSSPKKDDPDLQEVRAWAKENGVAELMLPRRVVSVEELPVLGTGKLNYGALDELANPGAVRKRRRLKTEVLGSAGVPAIKPVKARQQAFTDRDFRTMLRPAASGPDR